MYVPDHFRVDDIDDMHALMRARPFAALVSAGPSGLMATHLPTVLKTGGRFGVIHYHLARANPHWKDLGGEALLIFQGEEAPWAVSDAPDSYVDVMLRGIVGFRFEITRLQGKWKMSQNREDADRAGVVEGLKSRGDEDDLEMAALI